MRIDLPADYSVMRCLFRASACQASAIAAICLAAAWLVVDRHEGGGAHVQEAAIAGAVAALGVLLVRLARRRRLEESLFSIAQGVSAATSDDFFRTLVAHIARAIKVDCGFVTEIVADEPARVRLVAAFGMEGIVENAEYDVAGTACESVLAGGPGTFPSGVTKRFPGAAGLKALAAEAYVGLPLRDAQGRVLGTIGVIHRRRLPDPALAESVLQIFASRAASELERKHSEDRLRLSEGRTRQMFDGALDAVVMMDASGAISGWNRQAEAIFGWSREEALGRNLAATIIPAEHREAHARGLERYRRTGSGPALNRRVEMTALRRDGAVFPVELTIAALESKDGPSFSAFVRDITERRRFEEQLAKQIADLKESRDHIEAQAQLLARQTEDLAEARDKAVESTRAKSAFLAMMSHEIRTPMNGVIGMTGLLRGTPLNPEQQSYVRTIEASGEALLSIINDILDFSKIEAGRLTLETIEFDPRAVVAQVVELLAEKAQGKGLELHAYEEPDLPGRVAGDAGRLRQVLLNLVSNSIKFTETGEVVVISSLAESAGGDAVIRFEVRDSGIGIPVDARASLFDSFSQADTSTTRKYGGTGLGLAISKRLVALLGGEIGFESSPRRGTTFWFTARLARREEPAGFACRGDAESFLGYRALVIEPNAPVRGLLARKLASWGIAADAVGGASEAVAAMSAAQANARVYHVVVANEPAARRSEEVVDAAIGAAAAAAGAAIVLLRPFGQPAPDETRLRARGVVAALTKPVREERLFAAMRTALRVPDADAGGATPAADRAVREAAPEAGGGIASRESIRLLVVEDNAVNRKVASALLRRLGYHADFACNGLEALRAAESTPYDAILMDCQMPEMDGYEATARIRAFPGAAARIPIIAMTASAMHGDRERCLAAGMSDYVSKPIRVEDLGATLARWLGSAARG